MPEAGSEPVSHKRAQTAARSQYGADSQATIRGEADPAAVTGLRSERPKPLYQFRAPLGCQTITYFQLSR